MASSFANPQISIDVLDYCVEGDSFDNVDDGHVFTLEGMFLNLNVLIR
jgi:hypothetical protein